jgi:hypothetical protein
MRISRPWLLYRTVKGSGTGRYDNSVSRSFKPSSRNNEKRRIHLARGARRYF